MIIGRFASLKLHRVNFIIFALICATTSWHCLPLQAQSNDASKEHKLESPATSHDELRLEKPSTEGGALHTEAPVADHGELRPEKPAIDSGALHQEVPSPAPGSMPFTLPGSASPEGAPGAFKLGTTESRVLTDEDKATVDRLKKASNEVIQKEANKFFANGNYKLAQELYETLCQRDPKNPEYFYGAGDAYAYQGDNPSAFADFLTAWHLAGNPGPAQYSDAANAIVEKLKTQVDDCFKLTYNWSAQDQESILNGATRMWKAGFTKQSVQLNEYVLKNEPLFGQIAAYNLGAIAEHDGDYKQALAYYEWAGKRSRLLEQNATSDFRIQKSLSELPPAYVEQAISDVREALTLKGSAIAWRGWAQADTYPKHWSSEVCPLCAISRTQTDYLPGQMNIEH